MTEGVAPMLEPMVEPAVSEQLVPEATSAASLWLVMAKAYRSMQVYVESTMAEMGIGMSDFMILEALLHKGPMSMSQIGDKVLLANPSMTAAVDRLAKQGFVTRQSPSEGDRRVRTVELTSCGRKLIRKIFTKHVDDLETIMQGICPEQRAALRAALKNIGLSAKAKTEAS
jgi:MarR family 2-MHQ and catechol resistance regulon transcriptional repressor